MSSTNNTNTINSKQTTVAVEYTSTSISSTSATIKDQDPFLFYSDEDNLRRARQFEGVRCEQGDTERSSKSSNKTVVRKTRISFEMDALSILMDAIESEEFDDINGECCGKGDDAVSR
ncbi:predicted protein [Thalassiosira pseudonana CCMP1335]|uniref:Uncharacterized protein n=1 Tax=Thalassiosira pseudonana TaxID=35128 RepID=B8LDD1_THAPS|nr:predicted protein [Thalassiosira pseudonana CCMP1335]EED86787.1 predicted protein [Thalassiosira pseudonana CCMP1335]|eukprot:scaffold3204_cov185-Alexandrium_tamarense.AAC.15